MWKYISHEQILGLDLSPVITPFTDLFRSPIEEEFDTMGGGTLLTQFI